MTAVPFHTLLGAAKSIRAFTRWTYGSLGEFGMISFVNGFLCTSSCDVSKAKQGVDPHPKTDEVQNSKQHETKNGVVNVDDPAVVLGGALSTTAIAPAAAPSSSTQAQAQAQIVDLLV